MTPLQEKQLSIAATCMRLADEIVRDIKSIQRYSRKVPRIVRRKPFKKKILAAMQVQTQFRLLMGTFQIEKIRQQPIPKYPLGSASVSGPAIVGENGREVFVNNNGKIELI